MSRRVLWATALAAGLSFSQGCFLIPDDGSGTGGPGECTGGPVTLAIPAEVFCDVTRIAATISGPGMTTIEVAIERDNPAATLSIPSGPDRQLVVKIYTSDNPDTPFFTSERFTFCVPDAQPVSVTVDVVQKNRPPKIGSISPSGGDFDIGEPVSLSVSASDPDGCDSVKSYSWSTAFGSISGSGSTVTWTPQCPAQQFSCAATVAVTARDGRGGTDTTQATYQISYVLY